MKCKTLKSSTKPKRSSRETDFQAMGLAVASISVCWITIIDRESKFSCFLSWFFSCQGSHMSLIRILFKCLFVPLLVNIYILLALAIYGMFSTHLCVAKSIYKCKCAGVIRVVSSDPHLIKHPAVWHRASVCGKALTCFETSVMIICSKRGLILWLWSHPAPLFTDCVQLHAMLTFIFAGKEGEPWFGLWNLLIPQVMVHVFIIQKTLPGRALLMNIQCWWFAITSLNSQ